MRVYCCVILNNKRVLILKDNICFLDAFATECEYCLLFEDDWILSAAFHPFIILVMCAMKDAFKMISRWFMWRDLIESRSNSSEWFLANLEVWHVSIVRDLIILFECAHHFPVELLAERVIPLVFTLRAHLWFRQTFESVLIHLLEFLVAKRTPKQNIIMNFVSFQYS